MAKERENIGNEYLRRECIDGNEYDYLSPLNNIGINRLHVRIIRIGGIHCVQRSECLTITRAMPFNVQCGARERNTERERER